MNPAPQPGVAVTGGGHPWRSGLKPTAQRREASRRQAAVPTCGQPTASGEPCRSPKGKCTRHDKHRRQRATEFAW